uniref:interferon-inducible GTPase 5-like isoform X2 n=1 Tax=Pristiophorus japonicus TaxID=55135 RepID=UPI00398F0767
MNKRSNTEAASSLDRGVVSIAASTSLRFSTGNHCSDQSLNTTFFCPNELKKLKSDYETGGLEAAVPLIQKKIKDLNNTELNIAVTGESGTGKSTFINAMRGLRSDGEGAAKTGPIETTMKPARYAHPSLPNVYFWDLPGIGTTKFPADKYLREMDFKIYDFFIIFSACRFKENDVKLAKEIKRLGKNFYFIRSKIDNDLDSFEKEGVDFNKQKELDKIRNNCVSNLQEAGIESPTVFLISSFKLNDFDFPALKEALSNNLDDIKKHVFLLSLPNTTLEIVENKRKELKKQVWMLATLSGTVGAVPIPGLSFACDIGILVTAIIQFRQYLGLDDASLQRLANVTGKPVGDLKAVVETPLVGEINKEFVKRMLMGSAFVTISAIEIGLDFVPVVGSIFGAGSSFGMTYKLLNDALNELVKNAQRVVKAAFGTD